MRDRARDWRIAFVVGSISFCLLEVLGGDLVAKGIQQSLFIGHSVSHRT